MGLILRERSSSGLVIELNLRTPELLRRQYFAYDSGVNLAVSHLTYVLHQPMRESTVLHKVLMEYFVVNGVR